MRGYLGRVGLRLARRVRRSQVLIPSSRSALSPKFVALLNTPRVRPMYGQGFKPMEAMTLPDVPSAGSYLPDDGEPVPLTLEIYHSLIASLALDPPVDVVVHPTFDVARNLLLYAWFERSFARPAELHAFASLEMGLRCHLNGLDYVLRGRSSLRTLLKRAVEAGNLHDQCIHPYPRLTGFGRAWSRKYGTQLPEPGCEDTTRAYVDVLCDALPTVRNRLAHGHTGWAQTAFATLSACRDLLNCLGPFRAAQSEFSETD